MYSIKNNEINQKEETHQRSCDMVGSGRERSSAVGVGLARLDAPPDHVGDSDGLDPAIGGELESTRMRRIDPHRDTRPSVLHEELARRVCVNPQVAPLVVDRELLVPELVPRLPADRADREPGRVTHRSYLLRGWLVLRGGRGRA